MCLSVVTRNVSLVRGTTVLEGIHDVLPEWAALCMAVVTQLGDVWFLLLVAIGASWALEDERGRKQGPWPLAVVVGGLALLSALKYAFAMPRPETVLMPVENAPEALRPWYSNLGTAAGYGFPSGHALGSTVTFGLLAAVLDVGTRRQRIAVAAAIVGLVSFSRLVLGVHYPIDIVAGVLVGLAYLGATLWLVERTSVDRTTVTLAIASGLALVAAVVSDGSGSMLQLLALTAGALVVWVVRNRREETRSDRRVRVARAKIRGPVVAAVAVVAVGAILLDYAATRSGLFGLGVAPSLLSSDVSFA